MNTDNDEEYIGGYNLIRLLGKGHHAKVYLGQKEGKSEKVAIKVFPDPLQDPESVQQFEDEVRILREFDHYNIVRIEDYGRDKEHDGIPYIVMHKEGDDLRKRHPDGDIVSLNIVVRYVNQIAEALYYAHRRGVIHRDIKPSNILLMDSEMASSENAIRVSDFGIAALLRNNLQENGALGYYEYMAPEQEKGSPQSRSDQYALAVMVYEWLCGKRPFNGSHQKLVQQHASARPPSLRKRNPDISLAVEEVVMKGLSKQPEERYTNILFFAQALEAAAFPPRLLVTEPRLERKPALNYTRRNILVILLAMIASALVSWGMKISQDTSQQHKRLFTFNKHQGAVKTVAWSPDSVLIASAGSDKEVLVWDMSQNILARHPHQSEVLSVAWSSDSMYIASVSVDGALDIWDARSGKTLREYPLKEKLPVYCAIWLESGDLAVSIGKHALVYDDPVKNGFGIQTQDITFTAHTGVVNALSLSPKMGKIVLVASASDDGTVRIWDSETAQPANYSCYRRHTLQVMGVAWSSQYGLISSVGNDHTVQIWDSLDGNRIDTYSHTMPVRAVVWSPDGQFLVSGGDDYVAQIWNIDKSRSSYNGHLGKINAAAVSPKGKLVATASDDKTVHVWEV